MDRLTSPSVILGLLERYGLKTKKSFGQNFLVDENTLRKIAGAAELSPNDLVFEIGPGLGTMTQVLAGQAGKVIAFESDRDLLPVLAHTLAPFSEKVTVVPGDFLKVDLRDYATGSHDPGACKIVANLPYYITTPIMFHLFESGVAFSKAVFLVQREVARRITAAPGGKDYGALSVAVQFRSDPQIVADVPPTVFFPRPNVYSAILRLNMLPGPRVRVSDQGLFFQLVRAGFAHRRKTILNALIGSGVWSIGREECEALLREAGIDPRDRAERLSIGQFASLAEAFFQHTLPASSSR